MFSVLRVWEQRSPYAKICPGFCATYIVECNNDNHRQPKLSMLRNERLIGMYVDVWYVCMGNLP